MKHDSTMIGRCHVLDILQPKKCADDDYEVFDRFISKIIVDVWDAYESWQALHQSCARYQLIWPNMSKIYSAVCRYTMIPLQSTRTAPSWWLSSVFFHKNCLYLVLLEQTTSQRPRSYSTLQFVQSPQNFIRSPNCSEIINWFWKWMKVI